MTRHRTSALIVTFVLSLGFATSASAQLVPKVTPLFDSPATSTLKSRATSLFEAGQIVDRPTGDLRPRFHWGIFGSVIPNWSTPGGIGKPFFNEVASATMSGRDLRVGVVRARQLGFEMGVSFVQKTITSFNVVRADFIEEENATVTFSPLADLRLMGVDSHLVIPIARFGERVQLGILAAGGLAWIPDDPIRKRIQGPPFYASPTSTVPLSSPPATGGFVREWSLAESVPLVPGTTYGEVPDNALSISGTDYVWPLLRGQLAADFLLAQPLKIRVAAGFHYPGAQALGIDVVYLFRTGRLDPARIQAPPNDPGAAAAATAGQIGDRPQAIAPRRSYWGVLGGAAPFWFTPHWSEFFRNLLYEEPFTLKGREFRIGLTNGRPLGKEFGISYVQKSWTEFSFVREGHAVPIGTTFPAPSGAARITLSQIDPVQIPGFEFHAFVPIDRIASRVQLGGLFGAGAARVPDAAIQKRIEGPRYLATVNPTTGFNGLATLPAAGGFVLDEDAEAFPVAPGQTGVTVTTGATEVSPLGSFLLLARAQIAADVLIATPFKIRFSAGFTYPGAQLFNIEAVYLFGTGR